MAFLSVYLPLVRSDRVVFAMLVALALSIAELGGEIGGVIWLCQLMLAGLLLVAVLAWKSRWVLPLVALLPLGGGALALLGTV
ncbi:DUF3325 family protein [Pseudomonas sp. MOB-449]|nr:DUF3325 family protein [Pseudomonas sp. MOB-449]